MKWVKGQIKGVLFRSLEAHADNRGWLAELFRSDEMIDTGLMPEMGYVSVTHKGISRGPHEHVHQTDMFALVGPGSFKVKLWDNRIDSSTYGNIMIITAGEENPAIIVVPPGVVHGYINISNKDAWIFNFPNRLFGGTEKKQPVDEIRHENSVSSVFFMDDV